MQQRSYTLSFLLLPLVSVVAAVAACLLITTPTHAARSFVFPVIGSTTYSNDYYSPRSNGIHAATDVMAAKGSRLVAMTDGTIDCVASPEPSWGYSLAYTDDYGYQYTYIHINNDTPGTDNGRGGEMNAYAPDMHPGNRVVAGQLLGYVGDSGNAENTAPHLHLEISKPDGNPKNPFSTLNVATKIGRPVAGPDLESELLPFGTATREIDIAAGNFDADPENEVAAAVASNGIAKVSIYNADFTLVDSFNAFPSDYRDGIHIAAGDVDNGGVDEIVVGRNNNGRVRVFEPDGTQLAHFWAFTSFTGDTRVAAGDVDNDGVDEIIAAVGNNGEPRVSIFELDGTPVDSWLAYSTAHTKGLYVASGDLDSDGVDEIVVGVGQGSSPKVKVFEPDGTQTSSFYAFDTSYKGGVRVDVGELDSGNAGPEIMTVVANNGPPRIRLHNSSGTSVKSETFIEHWWVGSYDVAATNNGAWAAVFGNRRGSVRQGF